MNTAKITREGRYTGPSLQAEITSVWTKDDAIKAIEKPAKTKQTRARIAAAKDAAHIVHCVNVHDDLCKALLDMLSGPNNPKFWANGQAALEKAMK